MADRAARARHYQRMAAEAARNEATHELRSARYSAFRLAIFLLAAALLVSGTLGRSEISPPLVMAALAGFAVFAAAVFAHDRVEARRRRAAAARECAEALLARLARDWERLPAVSAAADAGADADDDEASPLSSARAVDLDVDGRASLMSLVAPLSSPAGQRVLRRWLLDPPESGDRIRDRQDAARALARNAGFREEFMIEVRVFSTHRDSPQSRSRFLAWSAGTPAALSRPAVRWTARAWTALTIVCVTGAIFSGAPWTRLWMPLSLAGFAASLAAGRRIQEELDAASIGPSALENVVSLATLAEGVPGQAAALDAIRERLARPASATDALTGLSRRVGWSELRRGAPLLHVPLQALLLWDFHVLFALDDWRVAHGARARAWLDAVAELDALIALGTLAHDEPAWAFPLIEDAAAAALKAAGLAHPLLPDDRRVPNDVSLGPPGTVLLVTGSNMAGKSTLLRAIGANVLLANAGAPVCAARMTLSRLTVATSLRTGDSLAEGVSGYMAGLLRLKQVIDEVDAAAPDGPAVLYLLDEILGGTNSDERRIAVREIAEHLLQGNAIGALTTHDLALADEPALKRASVPVHFRETVEPGAAGGGAPRMTFDYRLRPGLATSTNALVLLRTLGLPRPS